MIDFALSICGQAISAAFSWFTVIFDALGATGLLLAIFSIICAYRFLLGPLFSGKGFGSDKAKFSKGSSNSDTED